MARIRPRLLNRREFLAAGSGVVATAVAAAVGPHPVRQATGRSGDVDLLVRAEPHLRGLNRVALAYIDEHGVRYAGLGADEDTPFVIGSVSKTFCAAVLMDMVTTGEVSLQTTVREITDADGSALANVTMRELASHTSGLPDFTPRQVRRRNIWFGFLHADGADQDAAALIADVLDQTLHERGEFSYSTAGFALLGQLLALRAGLPYHELLEQRILRPLSLVNSYPPMNRGTVGPRDCSEGDLLNPGPSTNWRLGAACGPCEHSRRGGTHVPQRSDRVTPRVCRLLPANQAGVGVRRQLRAQRCSAVTTSR